MPTNNPECQHKLHGINIQKILDWIFYERIALGGDGYRLFNCIYWGYWPYGDGKAVQLTTRNDYITLTEKQVKDLIMVLKARLNGKVTATGNEQLGDFYPEDMREDGLR